MDKWTYNADSRVAFVTDNFKYEWSVLGLILEKSLKVAKLKDENYGSEDSDNDVALIANRLAAKKQWR